MKKKLRKTVLFNKTTALMITLYFLQSDPNCPEKRYRFQKEVFNLVPLSGGEGGTS